MKMQPSSVPQCLPTNFVGRGCPDEVRGRIECVARGLPRGPSPRNSGLGFRCDAGNANRVGLRIQRSSNLDYLTLELLSFILVIQHIGGFASIVLQDELST